jgi:hypothetical protein
MPEILRGRRPKARVAGLFASHDPAQSFATTAVFQLDMTFEGIGGNRHAGAIRRADGRTPWFKRGTPLRNDRQVSLLCPDEVARIAVALGVPEIAPEWLGCDVLVAGLSDFSFLPRGTRLFFASGAVLNIEAQNAPCRFSGAAVMVHYPEMVGLDLAFPKAARRLRGLVASVEKPGAINGDDVISLMVPEQWIWQPDQEKPAPADQTLRASS